MGNTISTRSTRSRADHDEEFDAYVLVDSGNVVLGLPEDEVIGAPRRPLRGSIPRKFDANPRRMPMERSALLSEPRPVARVDAAASISLWQKLARRVHLKWGGTRGTPRA